VSRGDPIFCRFDISLWWDVKLRRLSAAQKWVYFTLCSMAVEARRTVLPSEFDTSATADRAGTDLKTTRKALEKSAEVGLIRILSDGRIHIPGIRVNNLKIKGWRILPGEPKGEGDVVETENNSSLYGADNGHEEKREEEITEKREEQIKRDAAACFASRAGAHAAQATAEHSVSASSLVNSVINNLGAGREPDRPDIEPSPELIAKHIKIFEAREEDRRAWIGMVQGKQFKGENQIYDSAFSLPLDVFLQAVAYVSAWREMNPHCLEKAAAVLTNQFKSQIHCERGSDKHKDIIL
jgi:hypothetical protein